MLKSLETTQIRPRSTYKVFLVEEDDDLRERVISVTAKNVTVDHSPVDNIELSSTFYSPVEKVTMTIELNKREDGSFYTVENFLEEDEDA